jgi:hypothetical protein
MRINLPLRSGSGVNPNQFIGIELYDEEGLSRVVEREASRLSEQSSAGDRYLLSIGGVDSNESGRIRCSIFRL